MFYRTKLDAVLSRILKRSGFGTSDMLGFWPTGATVNWTNKGKAFGWKPFEAASIGVCTVALERLNSGDIDKFIASAISDAARDVLLESGCIRKVWVEYLKLSIPISLPSSTKEKHKPQPPQSSSNIKWHFVAEWLKIPVYLIERNGQCTTVNTPRHLMTIATSLVLAKHNGWNGGTGLFIISNDDGALREFEAGMTVSGKEAADLADVIRKNHKNWRGDNDLYEFVLLLDRGGFTIETSSPEKMAPQKSHTKRSQQLKKKVPYEHELESVLDLEQQASQARQDADEAWGKHIYGELMEKHLPAAQEAVKKFPVSSKAHHYLGRTCRILELYDAAISELEESIRLRSYEYMPVAEIVFCLGTVGRHDKAKQFAEKGVELAPDLGGAWSNLAVVLHSLGQTEAAKQHVSRAMEIDSSDPAVRQAYSTIFG